MINTFNYLNKEAVMRKNELGDLSDLHHVPREHKKTKKHQRGFREDVEEGRAGRLGFKNYLRDIEESELQQEEVLPLDDAAKRQILSDFKEWSGGSTPDECSEHEIDTYVSMALSVNYDEDSALEFLTNFDPEEWKD